MFRNLLCLVVGSILLTGCVHVHETKHVTEEKHASVQHNEIPDRLLRHVVLFKFKDSSTDEQIKEIEDAFCVLPDKVLVIDYWTN